MIEHFYTNSSVFSKNSVQAKNQTFIFKELREPKKESIKKSSSLFISGASDKHSLCTEHPREVDRGDASLGRMEECVTPAARGAVPDGIAGAFINLL